MDVFIPLSVGKPGRGGAEKFTEASLAMNELLCYMIIDNLECRFHDLRERAVNCDEDCVYFEYSPGRECLGN